MVKNKRVLIFLGTALTIILALFLTSFLSGQAWFNQIAPISLVQKDIDSGDYPIDIRNNDGLTGLMVAAKESNVANARALLAAGANPNARSNDADANTAMHFAVYFGDNESQHYIIDELFAYGADINARNNNGDTPMQFVMQIQSEDMRMRVTNQLLLYGIDMNARNKQGNTMLHLAADQNDITWFRAIRDPFGSLLNYAIKNNRGFTPKQVADDHGLGAMVDELNLEAPIILGANGNVNARNSQGRTGLMFGILRGDIPFVNHQIAQGADVNARDNDGNTPLHFANITRVKPLEFVNILLKAGARSIENNRGQNPLFFIGEIDRPEIRLEVAQRLIENGADALAYDKQGKNVLDYAVQRNDPTIVRLLKPKVSVIALQHAIAAAKKLNRPELVKILEK